jgi:DNA-binding beta-propeller fold protein YncE
MNSIFGASFLLAAVASIASAQTGSVLVSLSGEDKVALVDPATGKSLATFTVGRGPHEIAVSPDEKTAFVAVSGEGPGKEPGRTVAILELGTKTVGRRFELAGFTNPHDVKLDGAGGMLFVACAPEHAVLELDPGTGTLEKSWKTDAEGAYFVAVTPDGSKLYVPHLEGKRVVSIDRKTNNVRAVLTGDPQSGIDISPDGREVWVVDHEQRRINIIATKSDVVVGGVELDDSAFGRIRFTPNGERAVLVQGRRIVVIDTAKRKIVSAVQMPLAGKVLDISPDGQKAVVSNPRDDKLTIVGLEPLAVIRSFAAPGKTPDGVAWLR